MMDVTVIACCDNCKKRCYFDVLGKKGYWGCSKTKEKKEKSDYCPAWDPKGV